MQYQHCTSTKNPIPLNKGLNINIDKLNGFMRIGGADAIPVILLCQGSRSNNNLLQYATLLKQVDKLVPND